MPAPLTWPQINALYMSQAKADQTTPEQTRADQSRPDQVRPGQSWLCLMVVCGCLIEGSAVCQQWRRMQQTSRKTLNFLMQRQLLCTRWLFIWPWTGTMDAAKPTKWTAMRANQRWKWPFYVCFVPSICERVCERRRGEGERRRRGEEVVLAYH